MHYIVWGLVFLLINFCRHASFQSVYDLAPSSAYMNLPESIKNQMDLTSQPVASTMTSEISQNGNTLKHVTYLHQPESKSHILFVQPPSNKHAVTIIHYPVIETLNIGEVENGVNKDDSRISKQENSESFFSQAQNFSSLSYAYPTLQQEIRSDSTLMSNMTFLPFDIDIKQPPTVTQNITQKDKPFLVQVSSNLERTVDTINPLNTFVTRSDSTTNSPYHVWNFVSQDIKNLVSGADEAQLVVFEQSSSPVNNTLLKISPFSSSSSFVFNDDSKQPFNVVNRSDSTSPASVVVTSSISAQAIPPEDHRNDTIQYVDTSPSLLITNWTVSSDQNLTWHSSSPQALSLSFFPINGTQQNPVFNASDIIENQQDQMNLRSISTADAPYLNNTGSPSLGLRSQNIFLPNTTSSEIAEQNSLKSPLTNFSAVSLSTALQDSILFNVSNIKRNDSRSKWSNEEAETTHVPYTNLESPEDIKNHTFTNVFSLPYLGGSDFDTFDTLDLKEINQRNDLSSNEPIQNDTNSRNEQNRLAHLSDGIVPHPWIEVWNEPVDVVKNTTKTFSQSTRVENDGSKVLFISSQPVVVTKGLKSRTSMESSDQKNDTVESPVTPQHYSVSHHQNITTSESFSSLPKASFWVPFVGEDSSKNTTLKFVKLEEFKQNNNKSVYYGVIPAEPSDQLIAVRLSNLSELVSGSEKPKSLRQTAVEDPVPHELLLPQFNDSHFLIGAVEKHSETSKNLENPLQEKIPKKRFTRASRKLRQSSAKINLISGETIKIQNSDMNNTENVVDKAANSSYYVISRLPPFIGIIPSSKTLDINKTTHLTFFASPDTNAVFPHNMVIDTRFANKNKTMIQDQSEFEPHRVVYNATSQNLTSTLSLFNIMLFDPAVLNLKQEKIIRPNTSIGSNTSFIKGSARDTQNDFTSLKTPKSDPQISFNRPNNRQGDGKNQRKLPFFFKFLFLSFPNTTTEPTWEIQSERSDQDVPTHLISGSPDPLNASNSKPIFIDMETLDLSISTTSQTNPAASIVYDCFSDEEWCLLQNQSVPHVHSLEVKQLNQTSQDFPSYAVQREGKSHILYAIPFQSDEPSFTPLSTNETSAENEAFTAPSFNAIPDAQDQNTAAEDKNSRHHNVGGGDFSHKWPLAKFMADLFDYLDVNMAEILNPNTSIKRNPSFYSSSTS